METDSDEAYPIRQGLARWQSGLQRLELAESVKGVESDAGTFLVANGEPIVTYWNEMTLSSSDFFLDIQSPIRKTAKHQAIRVVARSRNGRFALVEVATDVGVVGLAPGQTFNGEIRGIIYDSVEHKIRLMVGREL